MLFTILCSNATFNTCNKQAAKQEGLEMCYVTYQIDRYLAAQDRATAREEWLGMQAQDDDYGRYAQDAMELMDGTLSDEDNQALEETGEFEALSAQGKEAIIERALDLAIEDGFSRYEE
jgi:hypothetical protein